MNKNFVIFVTRWLVNSLGLWAAVRLLGVGHDSIPVGVGIAGFLLAGLVFSVMNSILRPLIVILSLPAIILTLGLFMIIINGLMVYLSLKLSPSIDMTFLNSIYTGLVLSLVNYILDAVVTAQSKGLSRRKI
jgi:putative membrane protein